MSVVTKRDRISRPPPSAVPDFSIVVPVYNEENSVAGLLAELVPVLESLDGSHEILFINDGSRDGTLAALLTAQRDNRSIRVVNLSRNFG
jgi:glycosyltransferase involved in cell wall biosynthesis